MLLLGRFSKLNEQLKLNLAVKIKLYLTFEFEIEFDGEFKNCEKKSEDFTGKNLIFIDFSYHFFRFEKVQICRFDVEIEEENIE